MRPVVLFFTALFLTGCGSHAVRFDRDPSEHHPKSAIVFVPGFYGSALADAHTGERFFLSAWAAVFGRTPLAISQPDLGVEGARDLVPDGVLETVRIVPGLYGVNIYGDALDVLRDIAGDRAEVVPFDYDWRQDLHQSVRRLDDVVRRLEATGTEKVYVVAHSMGGLVAAYYARYGTTAPEQADDRTAVPAPIAGVVILGAPFGGAMTAFRNLQLGTSLGPAKTPLAQASLATFPAMYYLVPRGGSRMYLNGKLQEMDSPIHRFELWDRQGLGLLRRPLPEGEALRARRATAQRQYLERAERFMEKVAAPSAQVLRVPTMVVVGRGFRTFAKSLWTGSDLQQSGHWVFSDEAVARQLAAVGGSTSLHDDGDGTVPVHSARPPVGWSARFAARVIETHVHHEEMFGSESVTQPLRAFFENAFGKR